MSTDSHLVETLVRRRTVYRGRSVDFRADEIRLPDGKTARREFMDHPGAVGVVPFLDRATLVLVRQFRYPVGEVTLEIPAGKLHKGERILPCLKRELREETGCSARMFSKLIAYWPTPAFANEVLHLYVAEGLSRGKSRPDDDEFLEVVTVPFKDALAMVGSGRIRDSKTVIGILACALRRRN